DVAQLWWLTGAHEDGATIAQALGAAARFGLAGGRPASFEMYDEKQGSVHSGAACRARLGDEAGYLILGVDLPGPHAVLATPDGWWSWGALYDPASWPDAVIEEAWEVTW
ncbi:MAG TPA: hypothetical protein VF482_14550, partial [Trebonia sp.]